MPLAVHRKGSKDFLADPYHRPPTQVNLRAIEELEQRFGKHRSHDREEQVYCRQWQNARQQVIAKNAAGCLPFAALVFLNLLAITWPYRRAHSSVGKRMLATRWSPARLRRVCWAVAVPFLLMFPILVGWSLPPGVAWSSYLVAPLVILGGLLNTRVRTPSSAVPAMLAMAIVQFVAWFSRVDV